jgi:hypothetical protein
MRVAIYARVSTDDKGQDPENQLLELRGWCVNSGHTITQEYVEHESGRQGADKRKQFAALFDDAAKRKFDCVVFWALDRFSREGMAQTIVHLQRLTAYGVSFHSYSEPHLATDNELVRNFSWRYSRPWQRLRHRESATAQKRKWPELRPTVSKLAGQGSGSNSARELSNGLPGARRLTRLPRRSRYWQMPFNTPKVDHTCCNVGTV